MQSSTQHSFSLSTAGLMDRYLRNQHSKDAGGEPSKTAKEAFMKDVRLFRTRKGGIAAVIPRIRGPREPMTRTGRTIYTLGEASSFSMQPSNSIYVFGGDRCSLAVGGEYDAHNDTCGEPEVTPDFKADALFGANNNQPSLAGYYELRFPIRSHTPSSGRTTPELCWSPATTNLTDDLEFLEEELELESIFHQFIDTSLCEG